MTIDTEMARARADLNWIEVSTRLHLMLIQLQDQANAVVYERNRRRNLWL